MHSLFPTAAERDRVVREYGAVEGGKQTLERLGEQLGRMTAACEIVSTRLIAAPRERVYGAFRDPERLARWWGPEGFTSTIEAFDLRPGGAWRLTMYGPDGTDYPNESVFVEVVPAERVVYDHLGSHRFRMTISWADEGGATRVTWRMRFETPAECERMKAFVPAANEQNLDRLEAELRR
jgi:uncharacterized protein YndB with AHSA1/START domain